jgi:hypothetical protein
MNLLKENEMGLIHTSLDSSGAELGDLVGGDEP